MTAVFAKKCGNFSPLPLTLLEWQYAKFASERIFSLRHPLSDGGESMRISAPYPEIGAPNLEKCVAWYKQHMCNFFPFFGLCTPFLKYYRHAKFPTGALHPARNMAKKRGLLSWTMHAATPTRPARRWASGWCHITDVLQLLLIRSRQHGAAYI